MNKLAIVLFNFSSSIQVELFLMLVFSPFFAMNHTVFYILDPYFTCLFTKPDCESRLLLTTCVQVRAVLRPAAGRGRQPEAGDGEPEGRAEQPQG